jgi:type III restriction enzyme
METGTGKTYVYLRTIFELNRKYGFTKFIIVVPSIAIKEGVFKSLQITREHFKGLYDSVNYGFFVYDSEQVGQVRSFATSTTIQIMVINIDAFRKSVTDPNAETKANVIHRPHDGTGGAKPIDLIRETRPIVIIDEPQSVDSTAKSKEAIATLRPLCTLRYSATHKDLHHRVYRLDAVDAHERKLVKQIEVASLELGNSHNQAYIRLVSVDNKKGPITCDLELDVLKKGAIERTVKKKVRTGTDLLELSGGREVYSGFIVEDIHCVPGQEAITFTGRPDIVRLGQCIGAVDDDQLKRLQIKKTIEEHLDKELKLRSRGIKVLSLFFIDRVANYRTYDDAGKVGKGKYAQWFEAEYEAAIKKPKYGDLFRDVDRMSTAEEVHDGYFAMDKTSKAIKDTKGDSAADQSAYQLIMRDKEKLLSFSSPLKFIFSHSALKEGWDNPNVFQICTLNETTSVMKKRQQIGRGLRIAVDQSGLRVRDDGVNILTVMANESFEQFASELQHEIEQDTGIRFGLVEQHQFANLTVTTADGEQSYLGQAASAQIWKHLKAKGYIDAKGKVTDELKRALKAGTLSLPPGQEGNADAIAGALRKVAGNLNLVDANKARPVKTNKQVLLSPEFKALWDRIKHRTTYRVEFDPSALIAKCAEDIADNLVVPKAHFAYTRETVEISRAGVAAVEGGRVSEPRTPYESHNIAVPDLVSYLQEETQLTRRSIVDILIRSGKLDQLSRNPQKFIEGVRAIIKNQMQLFIVDGIKYERIGDKFFYAQELFETDELKGHLGENLAKSTKSPHDHVRFDSDVESEFVRAFEEANEVKVYAKLPLRFKIETPLGSYNPDWAVLIDRDGAERLYFVVESKSSLMAGDLRDKELAKIKCGKAHFRALGSEVAFKTATSYDHFSDQLGS